MLRPLNRSIQRSKDMDTGLFPRYPHKISNKLCQCFDFVLGGLGMTIENLKSILRINFFSSPNSVDTRSAKATFMAKHCTRKCTIFRVYVHSYLDSSLSFSKPEKIQILTSRTRPLHSDAKCLENIGFYMFILTLR